MASRQACVRTEELLRHLLSLEGERHPFTSPERLATTQDYVRACWKSWGLRVAADEFSYMGQVFVNLLAQPLDCPAGPPLLIGAHLDTVPGTPGADDNASGVAALLELSRVMAAQPVALPLEFVVFNLEELGMIGSAHYAAGLARATHPIVGMLSLEMIGFTESQGLQHYPWFLKGRYPPMGNYVGLAANRASRRLLDAVADAMRTVDGLPVETMVLPGKGWVFPESRLSDHSPFWDRGYPALLVTDTAFFRNPHYHQATDTVATLDLAFLTKVTQGLVATIEALASPLE